MRIDPRPRPTRIVAQLPARQEPIDGAETRIQRFGVFLRNIIGVTVLLPMYTCSPANAEHLDAADQVTI